MNYFSESQYCEVNVLLREFILLCMLSCFSTLKNPSLAISQNSCLYHTEAHVFSCISENYSYFRQRLITAAYLRLFPKEEGINWTNIFL